MAEAASRTTSRQPYFDWSPTEPDVFFHVGYNNNGNSGLDQNCIYKHTVSDTSATRSLWVDIIGGNTSTGLFGGWKNAITPDGKLYVTSTWAENVNPLYIVDLENRTNRLNYNLPTLDAYWGNTVATDTRLHDEEFLGNSSLGYWIEFYTSGESTHWRMRPWGTDGGAPIQWKSYLYSERELICDNESFRRAVHASQSSADLVRRLKGNGLSHLLVRADLFSQWAESQFKPDQKAVLQSLFGDVLLRLYQGHGYVLFAVTAG